MGLILVIGHSFGLLDTVSDRTAQFTRLCVSHCFVRHQFVGPIEHAVPNIADISIHTKVLLEDTVTEGRDPGILVETGS